MNSISKAPKFNKIFFIRLLKHIFWKINGLEIVLIQHKMMFAYFRAKINFSCLFNEKWQSPPPPLQMPSG